MRRRRAPDGPPAPIAPPPRESATTPRRAPPERAGRGADRPAGSPSGPAGRPAPRPEPGGEGLVVGDDVRLGEGAHDDPHAAGRVRGEPGPGRVQHEGGRPLYEFAPSAAEGRVQHEGGRLLLGVAEDAGGHRAQAHRVEPGGLGGVEHAAVGGGEQAAVLLAHLALDDGPDGVDDVRGRKVVSAGEQRPPRLLRAPAPGVHVGGALGAQSRARGRASATPFHPRLRPFSRAVSLSHRECKVRIDEVGRVGLLGRSGAGTCPNLLQRRSATGSAAKKSAEYQRFSSGTPARSGPLQQIWTTCRRGPSGEGGRGSDGDHDGRPDDRTRPARTHPAPTREIVT